jgi:putative peptide zinc metalloprotease protein
MYALKQEVRLAAFDSSNQRLTYQLIFGSKRVAVDSTTAAFAEYLRSARTPGELQDFASDNNIAVSQLFALLESSPIAQFFSGPANNETQPKTKASKSLFFLKLPLLPRTTVAWVAKGFGFMFNPAVALVMAAAIIAALALFIHSGAYSHHYGGKLTSAQWCLVCAAVYVSVLFHEIGHCAACSRYGARVGPIGCGLYLIWPVFYADVSDAWALTRAQRCIVDAAGIYFHMILAALCIIIALPTQNAVIDIVIKSILLSTVVNLNPFFRFDGYWLVTDVTGIPNLRRAVQQFSIHLFQQLFRRTETASSPLLVTKPHVRLMLGCYWVTNIAFCFYLTYKLFIALSGHLWIWPHQVALLCHALMLKPLSGEMIREIVMFTLISAGIGHTLFVFCRRLRRGYHSFRTTYVAKSVGSGGNNG